MMYTSTDIKDIKKQLKARIFTLAIPEITLLLLTVFYAVRRVELLCNIYFIAFVFLFIFSFSNLILPVMRYKSFLQTVLESSKYSTISGKYKSISETTSSIEDVKFYSVLINVGETNDENDDRLLYFDANLKKPDWSPNQVILFKSNEKRIFEYKISEV